MLQSGDRTAILESRAIAHADDRHREQGARHRGASVRGLEYREQSADVEQAFTLDLRQTTGWAECAQTWGRVVEQGVLGLRGIGDRADQVHGHMEWKARDCQPVHGSRELAEPYNGRDQRGRSEAPARIVGQGWWRPGHALWAAGCLRLGLATGAIGYSSCVCFT